MDRQHTITTIALCLFSSFACADTINLQFDKVSVEDFAKTVYSDIKQAGYIIEDGIAKETISINANNLQPSDIDLVINEGLRISGFMAKKIGNIYSLKKYQDEMQVNYYHPQNRKVSYITDLLRQAFPKDSFGFQAPVQNTTETDSKEGANQFLSSTNDVLVIRCHPDNYEKIMNFIRDIDKPVTVVSVTGGSYEFQSTHTETSSIQALFNLAKLKLNVSVQNVIPNTGTILRFADTNIQAVLNLLDTDTRFRSISKPSLLIDSGETATFNAGSDVPILTSTTVANGTATQNIEYRPSGTLLKVKPTVMQESISLDITQEYSNFIENSTSQIQSPLLNKRMLQSKITVKDGDVLVLAGLSTAQVRDNKSLFGFIPISSTDSKANSETLLLLQVNSQK